MTHGKKKTRKIISDKERMDWLDENWNQVLVLIDSNLKMRQAIDAAIRSGRKA